MPDSAAELDAQITQLQRDVDQLREQVGGSGVGAEDPEDAAAALTNMQETEALLDSLKRRRADLGDAG